jgi:hypothetical protein
MERMGILCLADSASVDVGLDGYCRTFHCPSTCGMGAEDHAAAVYTFGMREKW